MSLSMFLVGLAKGAFGILTGAVGLLLAGRALHLFLGSGITGRDMKSGNLAMGVLKAGSLLALGILLRPSVSATFNALDLMYQGRGISLAAVARLSMHAALHLTLAIAVSVFVLTLGTRLFAGLTRDVDEMKEIRDGNAAPAIVLAAVMVVLALMTEPGLQMALEGLLPLPVLGRNEIVIPQ